MTLPASPFLSESDGSVCPSDNAPAVKDWNPDTAGAELSQLMEIADHRFKLDTRAFMEAVEDIPLFLRRAV